ncbi:hypothetical protein [Alkalihalobacterium chitinilyticum]|uniref:ABC transporter permease n=1 Tax=Alkalihalobacterium chitinilyticum TaxID=2980103 RepID=A0ABT5VJS5_9BACI|nr:hypothetical protein [Alkalihalobacterium chitinilyticum]MDE5415706.1 hypothetical protein [Alkalihalobacterium chitinilyticum]
MSWFALYQKDLRANNLRLVVNISLLLLFFLSIFFIMFRYNNEFILMSFVPVLMLHVIYLLIGMFDSLSKEWRNHNVNLWLTIPQSGWSLITAKFSAVATHFLISLAVTFLGFYLFIFVFNNQISDPFFIALSIFHTYWYVPAFILILASLQLGAFATVLYFISKTVYKGGWILAVAIGFGAHYVWNVVKNTEIYRAMTEWGALITPADIQATLHQLMLVEADVGVSVDMDGTFYLGYLVSEAVIIVALLIIASWLLDRYVQLYK